MKYFLKDSHEYVENGKSLLRCSTVQQMPSPHTPGRILRVMSVDEVLHSSDSNPIQAGTLIALSFPSSKANAKEYEWNHTEEKQVALKFKT